MTTVDTAAPPAPATLDDARDQAARTDDPPEKEKRKRPAGKTRARKPAADAAPRTPRPPALKKRLEDFIVSAGAMLILVNARDGQLVIAGAPAQAAALDALAKDNAAVRRALDRLLTVSVYGQLVAAFAPTMLGLAVNHGMVPPAVASIAGAALAPTPPAADDAGPLDFLRDLTADDVAGITELANSMMGGGAGVPVGRIVGME